MLGTIALAVLCPLAAAPGRAQALDLRVDAVRADVDDLAAAVRFYEGLGFALASGERGDGSVVLESAGVRLVLRRVAAPAAPADGRAHVRLNLETDDLERATSRLREAGARLGAERTSQISTYLPCDDPAGNPFNVKRLFESRGTGDAIRPFNVGIEVADAARSRAFYEALLGMEVFSMDYFPPVVPYQKRGCIAFILFEDPDAVPADGGYGERARILLRLATGDLGRAVHALLAGGATPLDEEPRATPDGRVIAFADPDGNALELLEASAPASVPFEPASLAWMAGTWCAEDEGEYLEETWSAPAGDSLVGAFRWQRDGHTWMHELMAVARSGEGLVFRLRHFDADLVPWERERTEGPLVYPAVRLGEREAVFERADRDAPRRFVYRRVEDELLVRLDGPDGPGETFRFRLRNGGPGR